MRKLLAVGIVLTVLGGLDQGARVFAQSKLEERARAEVRGAASVDADISSFPFIGRLLVSGSVPSVEVRANRSELGDLVTGAIEVDLRDVRLERGALLSGKVRLQSINSGTITLELDADALGRALKVPVSIAGGEARVTLAGQALPATVGADDGALVVEVGGLRTLRVPISRSGLVSCGATAAEVAGNTVRLTCEIDEVPPALRG